MKVFIGNLPGQATLVELKGFLGEIELQAHFDCHRGEDSQYHNYYYFVARTHSEAEGLALIEQLNGCLFYDKRIVARPFQPRDNPCEPEEIGIRERRFNRDGAGEQIPLDL